MANRIGIELLPDVCRVVEVQASAGWFGRARARTGPSRVKAFHDIPYSPDNPGACAAELRRLLGSRGRDVRVSLWGLRSSHQVFLLPQAATADLETMARREARGRRGGPPPIVGTATVADGVTVGELMDAGRREIGYVSIPPAELQARIQPFIDAGLRFASVVTPAIGHMLLARHRWGQFGYSPTAVLSVNARATAVSVVRGGVVLFTREMPWGHRTEPTERGLEFDAAVFAGQLASELRRSLVFLQQQTKVEVGHVLVCGDLPDLRALTGPLMHELNLDIETLDSLDGFDVAHLPEPVEEFRARIGALRTAWVLAADGVSSVNLQPRDAGPARFAGSLDPQARNRLAVAALAGVLIAAASWAGTEFFVRHSRSQLETLRRQISRLGPEVQRLDADRRTAAIIGARSDALEAFVTQGPRLARVLESLGKGAPGEVVIHTMNVAPGSGTWRITITGQARGDTPALAQAVFNQFLRGASASPLLGQPVRSPAMSVRTNDPATDQADASVESRGGGGAAVTTPREQTAALERPRNVIVADPWDTLSPADRRTAEALGRRPQRVLAEPHWQLHPGGVPKVVADGVAAYNAEQSSQEQKVLQGTGPQPPAEPVERRAGSVLEFSVEFEVRK